MSGLRYYNQSVPKYINGEPWLHIQAKQRIREILERHGYDVETNPEHIITVRVHKDVPNVQFPVDVYAVSQTLPDTEKLVVQVDGEYHRASPIQKGRTQNRDETLGRYCMRKGIRYVVFNHPNCEEDIIKYRGTGYEEHQLAEMLGVKN